MKLIIRLIDSRGEDYTKHWVLASQVDKNTAQELINRDFSMFIEGGGRVEIIGQLTELA
jgi:hypothetical protein